MQASTRPNVFVQGDVFAEEPEREDYAMEVELGVNLVDTFTNKHVNFNLQATRTQTPASWSCAIYPPVCEVDACGLLPPECRQDDEQYSSSRLDLDDVAQEALTRALVEDQDAIPMQIDSMSFPDPGDTNTHNELEMVVFLYTFEKFRIVYA